MIPQRLPVLDKGEVLFKGVWIKITNYHLTIPHISCDYLPIISSLQPYITLMLIRLPNIAISSFKYTMYLHPIPNVSVNLDNMWPINKVTVVKE